MMRKILLLAFSVFAISNLSMAQITWADDIACILYTNCTNCHNPNGAAPFSLLSYADASSQALSIKDATQAKRMPPWSADRSYRSFAHERYLTSDELNLIKYWVDNGAPQGNIANAPVQPVYNSSEVITAPDYQLQIPTFTVAGSGDLYRCFVLDPGTTVDKYLTGLEIVPGNKNIVHHVLFFSDTTSTPATLDAADPGPGYTNYGGTGSTASILIGAWVPGQSPYFYPAGMGVRVAAGAKLIAQIHYPQGSAGKADSTKFNLLMTSVPQRNVTITPALNHSISIQDGPLFIPANTTRTFHFRTVLPAYPITVISVAPHMHLIGRKVKAWAITPANDTIPLVNVENWDFHWQTQYQFRKPLLLPPGTILYAEAFYDNTVTSPFQPSSPPQDVYLGESTTNEMMLIYFGALYTYPSDANIIVDTNTVKINYAGCASKSLDIDEQNSTTDVFDFYPNPSSHFITLQLKQSVEKIRIYNLFGELVLEQSTKNISNLSIDISQIPRGQYYINALDKTHTSTKKLLIE